MTRELPSGLLLDETLHAKEQQAKAHAEWVKAAEKSRDAVRATLRDALTALDGSLGQHLQTTHASLFARGATIENVADALARCWDDPTSFKVSELSQCITGFLRTHPA